MITATTLSVKKAKHINSYYVYADQLKSFALGKLIKNEDGTWAAYAYTTRRGLMVGPAYRQRKQAIQAVAGAVADNDGWVEAGMKSFVQFDVKSLRDAI